MKLLAGPQRNDIVLVAQVERDLTKMLLKIIAASVSLFMVSLVPVLFVCNKLI